MRILRTREGYTMWIKGAKYWTDYDPIVRDAVAGGRKLINDQEIVDFMCHGRWIEVGIRKYYEKCSR